VAEVLLEKRVMNSMELAGTFDCFVVLHRNEGRVNLLGTSGLYSKILAQCYVKSRGNVLLVIVNSQPLADDGLTPQVSLVQETSAHTM